MVIGRKSVVAIGVATFVIGLLVMFPARVAYQWVQVPGVSVSGISGTLWSGTASEASINNAYMRDVSWQNEPLQLLGARLGYAVSASPPSGFLQANVSVSIGGATEVSDLRAALPLSWLSNGIGLSQLEGTANLSFERFELEDGLPIAADGEVQVNNLRSTLLGPDTLGNYSAKFFTQADQVSASIEDLDAIVDLAGVLQISRDRTFVFEGKVKSTAETPQNLRQQLQRFYPPNDRDQHEIRLEGTL